MSARILDGKAIAAEIQAEIASRTTAFKQQTAVTPTLAAVLVGDDPASEVYVRNKRQACEKVGMASQLIRLSAQTSESELLDLVAHLNDDRGVHGILVQMPLPKQIRAERILDAVVANKDVDCFHPENVGLLVQGRPRFLPCTPFGCLQILHRSGISVAGKRAVVVGRSDIVGKPLATLLAAKDCPLGPQACNASVTVCHSRSSDLPAITREADILLAAIGVAQFIKADMVKPGAVIIDVGINRLPTGKIVGDVDFDPVTHIASAITPVPGGVGRLTVTMLLDNTLLAAQQQSSGA
jgi:methylenetetrahydrofolate dehydrogenase (NADP+)/methenyltetrahydrofolate cyclohydrolase